MANTFKQWGSKMAPVVVAITEMRRGGGSCGKRARGPGGEAPTEIPELWGDLPLPPGKAGRVEWLPER